jgi:hypothetical protein
VFLLYYKAFYFENDDFCKYLLSNLKFNSPH